MLWRWGPALRYNFRLGRGVARRGSAPAWGAGGRRCESSRPDQTIFRIAATRGYFFVERPVGQGRQRRGRRSSKVVAPTRCETPMSASDSIPARPITTLIPAGLHYQEAQILAPVRAGDRVENYQTTRVAKDGARKQI